MQRRMMMQSGRKDVMYNNAYDCVTKIIKQEGMRALFKVAIRGFLANVGPQGCVDIFFLNFCDLCTVLPKV